MDTYDPKILSTRIHFIQVKNAHGNYYIPEDSLEKVLDARCVESLVENTSSIPIPLKKNYCNSIMSGGRKTLGILLMIESPSSIRDFMEICENPSGPDHKLPLDQGSAEEILHNSGGSVTDKERNSWIASRFCKIQWQFLTAVFKEGDTRRFSEHVIFPYITEERRQTQGRCSTVFNLEVDNRYLRQEESGGISEFPKVWKMVRKEVDDDPIGKNEEQMNWSLRTCPNILPLFHSYRVKGKQKINFLYKMIDSDLEKWLKRNRISKWTNEKYFIAMQGLVAGLESLHNFKFPDRPHGLIGCHYDLKPANILVQDDLFILADFGEASFREPTYGSGQRRPENFSPYVSPEWRLSEDETDRRNAGRSSDVWSLGCIFLEVLIHMEYGHERLNEFRKRLTITQYVHCRTFWAVANRQTAVDAMLRQLSDTGDISIIALVKIIDGMLKFSPRRITILEVASEFGKIPIIQQQIPQHTELGINVPPYTPEEQSSTSELSFSTVKQPLTTAPEEIGVMSEPPPSSEGNIDIPRLTLQESPAFTDQELSIIDPSTSSISTAEASKALSPSSRQHDRNIRSVQEFDMTIEEQGRTKHIWMEKRLRSFMRHHKSQFLLLYTDLDDGVKDPLARISAELIQSFMKTRGERVALYNFSKFNDSKQGSARIFETLHNLILQLSRSQAGKQWMGVTIDDLLTKDTRSLAEAFIRMLQNLPPNTRVLVVLDDIQLFNFPHVVEFGEFLGGMVNSEALKPLNLKIFCNCTGTAAGARSRKYLKISKLCVLKVDFGLDDDRQGLTRGYFRDHRISWG